MPSPSKTRPPRPSPSSASLFRPHSSAPAPRRFPLALAVGMFACGLAPMSGAQSPAPVAQDAPMTVDATLPQSPPPGPLSNKWRLEFSGAAESEGSIVLEIQPKGRPPVQVTARIERNDGENRVARKVKTAIDRQAGAWVDAELDDGEDVLVERRLFKPRVGVRLVSSRVKAVRINFDRE